MGSCKSSNYTNYSSEEWNQTLIKGGCYTLNHRYNNVYALQKWISTIPHHSDIYQWRKSHTSPFFITIMQTGQSQYQTINYIITEQHIQLDKLRLTKSQAVNLTYSYLIGFIQLINKFGLFNIDYGMMLVNRKGYPKVWINNNLAVNYPQYTSQQITERIFINKIKTLINQTIINKHDHLSFINDTFKGVLDQLYLQNTYYQSKSMKIDNFDEIYNNKNTLKKSIIRQFPYKLRFITEDDQSKPIRDYTPINNKHNEENQAKTRSVIHPFEMNMSDNLNKVNCSQIYLNHAQSSLQGNYNVNIIMVQSNLICISNQQQ